MRINTAAVKPFALAFASLSLMSLANAQKKSTKLAPPIAKTTEAIPLNDSTVVKDQSEPVPFNAKDVWNVDIFNRDDHKVLVIQDRKYNKAGRLELGLDLGKMSSSPYYSTLSYGGHATYHLSEYWGVEFYGAKYSSNTNAENKQLKNYFDRYSLPTSKEFREADYFTSASAVWSPIYGKFAFFRSNIIHFDFYVQGGVSLFRTKGILTTETLDPTNAEKATDQKHVGPLMAVGSRVFINEQWIWRFDVRNNIYSVDYAATSSTGARSKYIHSALHFTTGVSMLFNVGGF